MTFAGTKIQSEKRNSLSGEGGAGVWRRRAEEDSAHDKPALFVHPKGLCGRLLELGRVRFNRSAVATSACSSRPQG